jgi:hypothetical protein
MIGISTKLVELQKNDRNPISERCFGAVFLTP